MTELMGTGIEGGALLGMISISVAVGLGSYALIGGIFEIAWYRRRERAAEWKCQPRRWPTPRAHREEILLGAANMIAGSVASGILVSLYLCSAGSFTRIYLSPAAYGLPYLVASTIAYALGTDLALYWAHRIFHTPFLYRKIHRVHHRWGSPTAFTATAMHPVEFATYQSVMMVPLFFVPLNGYAVIATLLLTNYYALVDHSGVRMHSWLPFVAPTMFHDDHHAHFHVNYGQSLLVWDRLFGTARRRGRRYGVDVFGGKGAGEEDLPLYDYRPGAADDGDRA